MKSMLLKGLLLLVVIQSIVIYAHLWVFNTWTQFLNQPNSQALNNLKIALIVLAVSFLVTSVLANNFVGSIINGLYTVSAIWMGTFFWLFLAAVLSWVLHFVAKYLGLNLSDAYLVVVLFGLALVISAYGVYHSYQTQVVTYKVQLPNLPEAWQGRRVVFVSDTHLGNIRGINFIRKVAKLIDMQKPEVVLIPGDYYDGPPADFEALAKAMAENVHAPQGIYFTSGNHEEFRDSQSYLAALKAAGIKIINNQTTELQGLQLVGTDYAGNNTDEGLAKTLSQMVIDKNKPSIMLKHAPLAVRAASDAGINLMISGHTHQGQVWPLGYLTKIVHKGFDYGFKKYGNMSVITSSGAGTWGPPQRVGTQSEIVVLELEKQ